MNTMTIGSNNDYVTLLTQEEAETLYTTDALRTVEASEYAQSQNAYVTKKSELDGSVYYRSYWMTRTADISNYINYVKDDGTITNGKVSMTYYGVRPVISINL